MRRRSSLIDAAKSLGKLDELAAQIKAIKSDGDDPFDRNERAKLAFAGVIAIARGDDDGATQALKTGKPLLAKLTALAPEWVRWPELLLAARAIKRPSLRQPAVELLDVMAEQSKQKKPTQAENKASSELWTHQIKNIRARATVLAESEKSGAGAAPPYGAAPLSPQWAQVTADAGRDTWHGQAHSSLGTER